MSDARQRIRVRFCKGDRVRFISHLDVLRYWERAIRRADLPLLYSKGFTPHPRITFAAPLPLGFLGEREIMEVVLEERVPLDRFAERIRQQTTPDLDLGHVSEVGLALPALPNLLRWADYRAVLVDVTPAEAATSVAEFLATEHYPWEQKREGKKPRQYDLRTATASLSVEAVDGSVAIDARLSAGPDLTVRPEQLIAALFPAATVPRYVRTGLVLDEPSAALQAWRERGQYE